MDQSLQWSKPGSFLLVAVAFLAAAAVSSGNIGEFDEHWQTRKEAAEASARETYKPDPFNVTNNVNRAVHRHVTFARSLPKHHDTVFLLLKIIVAPFGSHALMNSLFSYI